MSGITEFAVSTDVLQDSTLAKSKNYNNFHVIGTKGPLTQGPSSVIDPETCFDYFTQVNKNGIACWDTRTKLSPSTFSEYQLSDKIPLFRSLLLRFRNIFLHDDRFHQISSRMINNRIIESKKL